MEHAEEYNKRQQVPIQTSDASENDISETIDFVPTTILDKKYKKKNKKVFLSPNFIESHPYEEREEARYFGIPYSIAPYKPADYISESTEARYNPHGRGDFHRESDSSLKELYNHPQNYSKENTVEGKYSHG